MVGRRRAGLLFRGLTGREPEDRRRHDLAGAAPLGARLAP
jgi:hypothetical protein